MDKVHQVSPALLGHTLELQHVLLSLSFCRYRDSDNISRPKLPNIQFDRPDFPTPVIGTWSGAIREENEFVAKVRNITEARSTFHGVRPEVLTVRVENECTDISTCI